MVELKKEEDWKLENIVPLEDDHDVNRVLELATEYAQLMGFGGAETTIVLTSIIDLAKNMLAHSTRGMVGIRAISIGSKKRLMFLFLHHWIGKEDVRWRLRDDVLGNGTLQMVRFSGRTRMADEIVIESDPEDMTTIQITKRLRCACREATDVDRA
jgi:hypothetical protein